jgi:multiple sugar transport system ATP-binding protein
MANLSLKGLNKIYPNGVHAVYNFDMDIYDGEFIVFVGPSGCGKSTTLRMIAGLEEISSGTLFIDDKNVTNTPPKDRDIAMVFQNYALYHQMTVYHNMAFSLMLRKVNADVIHEKVMRAARLLGLVNQLNKKPKQLSGGQRQRVAVGRAIVRNPKVFLFDEPLSNLDAKLRGKMRHELKLLHQTLNSTMIYVTHDQIEALTLADRIVVMNNGYVQQIGAPIELYDHPANIFVAGFIGLPAMNFLDVLVTHNGTLKHDCFEIELKQAEKDILKDYMGKEIVLGIRPENAVLGNDIEITVNVNENLGQYTNVHGYIGKKRIILKILGWHSFKQNDKIKIDFLTDKIHFFDKETTKALR